MVTCVGCRLKKIQQKKKIIREKAEKERKARGEASERIPQVVVTVVVICFVVPDMEEKTIFESKEDEDILF